MGKQPVSGIRGARLTALREEAGLTQIQLEGALRAKYGERGPGRATIQNYESERRQPKAPQLAVLADYFDVTADYLLGRDRPVTVSPEDAQRILDAADAARAAAEPPPQGERRRRSRRAGDTPPP